MNTHNSAPAWCGRLDLHLQDRQQQTAGMLEISLRLGICTVGHHNRTLAVIHREDLRSWLFTPRERLRVDDLVWSLEGHRVTLSIDRLPPYLVPGAFVGQLTAVI